MLQLMDPADAPAWIAACAQQLQLHWRTVDPRVLEEVARELSQNAQLRPMAPVEAAALWLRPVQPARDGNATPTPRQTAG